jgi:hypothetical protein
MPVMVSMVFSALYLLHTRAGDDDFYFYTGVKSIESIVGIEGLALLGCASSRLWREHLGAGGGLGQIAWPLRLLRQNRSILH